VDLLEIGVTRLPGIEPGFRFDLQPGLNLLTGPNGSGKSSVARAVAWLLWPKRFSSDPQREIRVRLQSAGRTLTGVGAASSVIWTEDGRTVPAPELPPGHLAACYHLDILDLMPTHLDGDDADLARRLTVDLAGGLDTAGLRDSLFTTSGLSIRVLKRDLEEARRRVRTITSRQEALDQDRRKLKNLERDSGQARLARERRDLLAALRDRRDLERELEDLRSELGALAPGAARMGAQDLDLFDQRRQDLQNVRAELENARSRCDDLQGKLPADPPTSAPDQAGDRAELEGRITELKEAEARLDQARRTVAEWSGAESTSGLSDSDSVAGDLDADTVRRIQDAWEKYRDRRAIADGLRDLGDHAPAGAPQRTWVLGIAPAMTALIGLALMFLAPDLRLWGGVVCALGLAGGIILVATRRGSPVTGAEHELRLRDAELKRDQARSRLTDLLQAHGVSLDLEDADGFLVLDRVRNAQDERRRLAKARSAEAAARQQRDLVRDAVNTLLVRLGRPTVDDGEAARGALVRLDREWSDRAQLGQDLAAARLECDRLERLGQRYEQDDEELFRSLELDADHRNRRDLEQLQRAGSRHHDLVDRIKETEGRLQQLDRGLAALDRFFPDDDPRQWEPGAIAERLLQEEDLAARADEINTSIGALSAELEAASQGHDLESALADEARLEGNLAATWRTRLEDGLGCLLLDEVSREYSNTTRPDALDRAEDLLDLITGLPYTLACSPLADGQSTFVVHDPDTRLDLDLARLSTGTRTQLLLAVRMGFLAAQNIPDHPPLFLDDALTTSDPERFAAAVVGLGRIAREKGLQIISICARPSEVDAWRKILARENLDPPHVVDLAEVRKTAAATPPDILSVWSEERRADLLPPDPAGMDGAAYAAALQVPQPGLFDEPEALHLFYLLSGDLPLLHRLLTAGVSTVGRWRQAKVQLAEGGTVTPAETERLDAVVKLWHQFLPLWRRGRPPRITPQILQESVLGSSGLLPQIQEFREKVCGSGKELIAGLREKKVKRLQQAKVNELESDLRQAGYIVDDVPPGPDDVIRKLTTDSQSWPAPLRPDTQTIHLLVDRLAKTLLP